MIETLDVINIKEKGKKIKFIFHQRPSSVTDYYGQQMTPEFKITSNHFSQVTISY